MTSPDDAPPEESDRFSTAKLIMNLGMLMLLCGSVWTLAGAFFNGAPDMISLLLLVAGGFVSWAGGLVAVRSGGGDYDFFG